MQIATVEHRQRIRVDRFNQVTIVRIRPETVLPGPVQGNHTFSLEESSFSLEESLKNLHFDIKTDGLLVIQDAIRCSNTAWT